MTPQDFDKFNQDLNNHDWFYDYSDDGNVWRRGSEVREHLMRTAESDPVLQSLYDLHYSAVYNVRSGFTGEGLTPEQLIAAVAELRAQTFGA
jgi:hypothetical protein